MSYERYYTHTHTVLAAHDGCRHVQSCRKGTPSIRSPWTAWRRLLLYWKLQTGEKAPYNSLWGEQVNCDKMPGLWHLHTVIQSLFSTTIKYTRIHVEKSPCVPAILHVAQISLGSIHVCGPQLGGGGGGTPSGMPWGRPAEGGGGGGAMGLKLWAPGGGGGGAMGPPICCCCCCCCCCICGGPCCCQGGRLADVGGGGMGPTCDCGGCCQGAMGWVPGGGTPKPAETMSAMTQLPWKKTEHTNTAGEKWVPLKEIIVLDLCIDKLYRWCHRLI